MSQQDECPTTPQTSRGSGKTTASSMLALFSPSGHRRQPVSGRLLSPANTNLHQQHSSALANSPDSNNLMLGVSPDRPAFQTLLERLPENIGAGLTFKDPPAGLLPPAKPRTPLQAYHNSFSDPHAVLDDSDSDNPHYISDVNFISQISPQTPEPGKQSTACPHTPANVTELDSADFPVESPPQDTRGSQGHSLRARDKLMLSAKAKENLQRGFKDPRHYSPISQKQDKPATPTRGFLATPYEKALEEKQSSFLWKHKDVFLPLLPESNHITQITARKNEQADPEEFNLLHEQPQDIIATLKKHQFEGLSFLIWLRNNAMNGILGDEMGLGKTLQTLSILHHDKTQRPLNHKPSIVVCPLSVLETWQAESQKHIPSLRTMIYYSNASRKSQLRGKLRNAVRQNSLDILIISYETYVAEQYSLRRYKWSYAVLDEGHKVKNADSKVSQALQGISADYRLILTGTPIQNNLFELWSLLHWLLPRTFNESSRELFELSFDLSQQHGIDIKTIGQARKVLELIMLRRTKDDLQGDMKLPALRQVVLSIPMAPQQRDVYKACITKSDGIIMRQIEHEKSEHSYDKISVEEKKKHRRELLNILMQLRKVSVHPYLIPGIQPDPYRMGSHVFESSGKFLVLKELLSKLVFSEGKKVIIFSGFKGVLDCIEDLIGTLKEHRPHLNFLRIDGDRGKAHRNLSVRLFQEQDQYQIMLATSRAGGFGITLTAAEAVIFMDQDWNPQVGLQAAGRAHRIGQTKEVIVYKMLSRGSVEEQMERRIAKKLFLSIKVTDSFKNKEAIGDEDNEGEEEEEPGYDGTSQVPKFTMFDLASIIRGGNPTLDLPSVPFREMIHWSYEDILANCEEKRSTQEIDEDAERKWLEEKENVKTTFFEGVNHERVKGREEKENSPILFNREMRRVGKETTVTVDGFQVSKWSLEQAESESTYDKNDSPLKTRNKTEKQFEHIETCIFCSEKSSEELIECVTCPKVFHETCLEQDDTLPTKTYHASMMKQCPSHKCCACLQSCSNCGGLLYNCVKCPRAFCEDHVEWSLCKPVGFQISKNIDLGFDPKQAAFYIVCKLCSSSTTLPVRNTSGIASSPKSNPAIVPEPQAGISRASAIVIDEEDGVDEPLILLSATSKRKGGDAADIDDSPTKKNRQS